MPLPTGLRTLAAKVLTLKCVDLSELNDQERAFVRDVEIETKGLGNVRLELIIIDIPGRMYLTPRDSTLGVFVTFDERGWRGELKDGRLVTAPQKLAS